MTTLINSFRRMQAELLLDIQRWVSRGIEGMRSSKRTRLGLGLGGAAIALVAPASAMAQPGTGGGKLQCSDAQAGASKGLVGTIETAATFIIIVGGALALLMLAIGGFRIVIGGAQKGGDAVKKGMDTIKYALIGVGILVAGVFLRELLVKVINASPVGTEGKSAANCIQDAGSGSSK